MPSSPPLRLLFFDAAEHVDFAYAETLGFGQVAIPACDEARIAAVLARASLPVVMDVALDRIALAALAEAGPGAPFDMPADGARLDPRLIADAEFAHARLVTVDDAQALAGWWGARLRAWDAAGLAGFRLLGLGSFPDHLLLPFCTVLRELVPGAILLGWTPGLRRSALRAMAGSLLDGVFASLPWWDFQSGWLWDELLVLADVAPVLGVASAPFGPSAAGRPTGAPSDAARLARACGMAASFGQGWMHVAGSEAPGGALDVREIVQSLNAWLGADAMTACRGPASLPLGDGGPILALLRCDAADHRAASRVSVTALNIDPDRPHRLELARILPALGGRFGRLTAWPGAKAAAQGEVSLDRANEIDVAPGGLAIFTAEALPAPPGQRTGQPAETQAADAARAPRLAIESPAPCVDGGLFPVKRVAGETVRVEADIVFDGHDQIAVALRWRGPGEADWRESRMRPLGNDRWQGAFSLGGLGRHDYAVIAWRDRFASYRDELAKKSTAGLDVNLELIEGQALLREALARAGSARVLDDTLAELKHAAPARAVEMLLSEPVAAAMAAEDDRPFLATTANLPVDAERIGARYASWYEVFPRSLSDDATRHGTFADVERHLPRIRDMGFDVLYFPPIHPIGRKNRKGRNNTLTPAPDDPGSPYAIGSDEGGHDALHPELGTLADFRQLRARAAVHGLELAMDFAIQCSPDHPWLREHPGWFDWRPDGTIRYAENPPKKYEDIVNVDFYARDAVPSLWEALCRVVLFWAGEGVRLFRVDNPHTKPFPFWAWMIGEVRARYPDAVFLAEAFTRPKIMYRLAKIGFSQSYTYFTWRNEKRELTAYFSELADGPGAEFFRPHLFVNTPDINPVFLQSSGRPGFLIRAALAATLSGLWGVYNGFELCEAQAVPGKEEYLDSEKYQLRAWDWERPGNIVAEITQLNQIRRRNPALQTHLGVQFHNAFNDAILYYEKATLDRTNVVLVAVSLDPLQPQEADFEIPLWNFGLPDSASVAVEDLLSGARFVWTGKIQHLRLMPERPYAIFRIRPA